MESKRSEKKLTGKRQSQNMSLREEAARQIVEKYTHRLKSLVRLILNDKIRQKEGTSAVVQEVFNSFFKKSIDITDPNSFGTELLTTITRRKSKNTIKRYERIIRDYRREQEGVITGNDGSEISVIDLKCMASGPSPEDAARLVEMIGMLSEREPEVAIWLFEGHTYTEVANKLDCAERTIQRIVKKIREKWRQYIDFQGNQSS